MLYSQELIARHLLRVPNSVLQSVIPTQNFVQSRNPDVIFGIPPPKHILSIPKLAPSLPSNLES